MRPETLFIPLLGVIGFAITMPAWSHYLARLNGPAHVQFLAGLLLPVTILLFGASWLEPGR